MLRFGSACSHPAVTDDGGSASYVVCRSTLRIRHWPDETSVADHLGSVTASRTEVYVVRARPHVGRCTKPVREGSA